MVLIAILVTVILQHSWYSPRVPVQPEAENRCGLCVNTDKTDFRARYGKILAAFRQEHFMSGSIPSLSTDAVNYSTS